VCVYSFHYTFEGGRANPYRNAPRGYGIPCDSRTSALLKYTSTNSPAKFKVPNLKRRSLWLPWAMDATLDNLEALKQRVADVSEEFGVVDSGGGVLPSSGAPTAPRNVDAKAKVRDFLAKRRRLRESTSLPELPRAAVAQPSVPAPSTASVKARQFTYGITFFDDETIAELLKVDHEARRRPALLVNHRLEDLSTRDVHRADILSRIVPPAPEEMFARDLELMLHLRRGDSEESKPCGRHIQTRYVQPHRDSLVRQPAHVLTPPQRPPAAGRELLPTALITGVERRRKLRWRCAAWQADTGDTHTDEGAGGARRI
jgi:hypothetical protein